MPGVAVEHHDVVVIGGGWSGMAAAVTLADAGVRVLVLEASDTLGGRARRIELDGMAFDNGQHLLLGAYRETLRLIHRVHRSRQGSQLYRRLPLSIDGPGPFRLRAPRLPAPLHMVAALLTARDCTLPERFALVRRFASWQRSGWRAGHADRVSALIADQPARMTERLWAPLCLAALNTPVEEASARVYLNVLRDAFAADRNASDLIIPVVDLSTLFPDAAAEAVVASGGEVRRHARARRVDANAGSAIVVTDDATLHCRAAIVATGPWQVHPLLDDQPCAADALCAIERYQYQPICTVYLRYARAVASPGPMVQLEGGPGQWLFDPGPTAAGHHHLAVVISADGAHRFITHAQLVAQVTQQLAANFPAFAGAAPVWARVITERRATHACTPDRSHPRAGELDSGIYLAGDHTDPDYPATLEAACRSGIRAANAVLARSTPGGIG